MINPINPYVLFHLDALADVMIVLISFIAMVIAKFSIRYLRGDSQYRAFFLRLGLLYLSLIALVSSNNVITLLIAWITSNLILARLMVHKTTWKAALSSGRLALKNMTFGFGCLCLSFIGMVTLTHQTSIDQIVHTEQSSPFIIIPLTLLTLGALAQSGLWPFHRWLLSSLNAPTPVSAMMHAGLINGGGFIILRFSPLYANTPFLSHALFLLGLLAALLGGLWKLMQHDVKRLLACSTMSQMGFMMAQCGLGLYPAALAHICWHASFKAYQFLGLGYTVHEKASPAIQPNLYQFLASLCIGLSGCLCFAWLLNIRLLPTDTTAVSLLIAYIASTHICLSILTYETKFKTILAVALSTLGGLVYGSSILLIEHWVRSMEWQAPLPLNGLHAVGMLVLCLAWLGFVFKKSLQAALSESHWHRWFYVKALNASQPHPSTTTTHRPAYRFQ